MGWKRKNKDKKMRSSKEVNKSVRRPIAQPGTVHKSKKDYNRQDDTSLDDAWNDKEDQIEEDNDLLDGVFDPLEVRNLLDRAWMADYEAGYDEDWEEEE